MFKKLLFPILFITLLSVGLTTFAGKSNSTHVHLQIEGGDRWDCEDGTRLEGRFWINFNEYNEYDDDGNLMLITWTTAFHGTVSNFDTGEVYFKDRFGGQDSFDRTTQVYTQSGATHHLFKPGEGTLYHSAGRISVSGVTGEVFFETGKHPPEFPSFCDLLGFGTVDDYYSLPGSIKELGPK